MHACRPSDAQAHAQCIRSRISPGGALLHASAELHADARVADTRRTWLQGIDFGSNIAIPSVDFATLHLYPGNWLLKPNEYHWLIPNYMADRAGIALKAGKPIILEVRAPAPPQGKP